MIQSPLLTSLMALCIFSLFSLVMLGQRYTTPIVTVVCPVTNLHHMASLQSASSCNCTSYAGIVSHVMILNALSNNNHHNYKRLCWHVFCHLLQIKSISIMHACVCLRCYRICYDNETFVCFV